MNKVNTFIVVKDSGAKEKWILLLLYLWFDTWSSSRFIIFSNPSNRDMQLPDIYLDKYEGQKKKQGI